MGFEYQEGRNWFTMAAEIWNDDTDEWEDIVPDQGRISAEWVSSDRGSTADGFLVSARITVGAAGSNPTVGEDAVGRIEAFLLRRNSDGSAGGTPRISNATLNGAPVIGSVGGSDPVLPSVSATSGRWFSANFEPAAGYSTGRVTMSFNSTVNGADWVLDRALVVVVCCR